MSAADGCSVVSIRDKDGRPRRRVWRAAVQLPTRTGEAFDDSARHVTVLGTALVSAEHATEACQIICRAYPGCTVFGVEDFSRG